MISFFSTQPNALQAPRLMRRMACWLYEGLLLFGVVFITDYLFSTLTQTRNALDNRHAQQATLFFVLGLYFSWFGHKGQTLAMKTWGIRLVDENGDRLTMGKALLRYLTSWIWFAPPLLLSWIMSFAVLQSIGCMLSWIGLWALSCLLRVDQQFWHDIWAGTRLVLEPPKNQPTE
jgi:uncharacterized RDD family membrane protein YckC